MEEVKNNLGLGLKEFANFMALKNPSWQVISKTDNSITFQKIVPPRKASCLLILVLLLFFVIPAIIYAIVGSHPGETLSFTVTDNAGLLSITGSQVGWEKLREFTEYKNELDGIKPPSKGFLKWLNENKWNILISILLLPIVLAVLVNL